MLQGEHVPPLLEVGEALMRRPQLQGDMEKWTRHANLMEENFENLGRKITQAHTTGMAHRESLMALAQGLVDTAQLFPRMDGENCLAKFGLTLAKIEISHECLLSQVRKQRRFSKAGLCLPPFSHFPSICSHNVLVNGIQRNVREGGEEERAAREKEAREKK